MEEGFVNVNKVPTRVISIGGWIDQPVEKRNLILIIPGKLQYTSYHIYICCAKIFVINFQEILD